MNQPPIDNDHVEPGCQQFECDSIESLKADYERSQEEIRKANAYVVDISNDYRKAWHALNALAADGIPYAKKIVSELPRPTR